MRKRGFLCKTDFECEFLDGMGGSVFPTLDAAKAKLSCAVRCGIVEVEIIVRGAAGRRNHYELISLRGHGPGYMTLESWRQGADFSEQGSTIFPNIVSAWRALPPEDKALVDVDVRLIRTALAPYTGAYVYEHLLSELGQIHPTHETHQ